jgi:signal transduction histidine kinase
MTSLTHSAPAAVTPPGGDARAFRIPARWWVAGFLAWTGLALLSVLQFAIRNWHRGRPLGLASTATFQLADWYACGAFIPLLVIVTRRWPIDRRHLATRIPLHAALLIGASLGKLALDIPLRRMLGLVDESSYLDAVAGAGITETIAFACVAAALHAIEFYRRYRERETQALQLQARLSDAQLRALRAQLNPHFLFNTLNAATTLLHRDPHAADAMLTRLGELLRITLRFDPEHETPLREEMELLDRYLAIMQARFSDRVTIRRDVDPAVAAALVPSFILQPLLENAFEHGVAKLQRPGTIAISARESNGTLVLSVRDDGPGDGREPRAMGAVAHGKNGSSRNGNGVGLTNTRHRLSELYGTEGSLTLTHPASGGTVVEVRLPLRLEPVGDR